MVEDTLEKEKILSTDSETEEIDKEKESLIRKLSQVVTSETRLKESVLLNQIIMYAALTYMLLIKEGERGNRQTISRAADDTFNKYLDKYKEVKKFVEDNFGSYLFRDIIKYKSIVSTHILRNYNVSRIDQLVSKILEEEDYSSFLSMNGNGTFVIHRDSKIEQPLVYVERNEIIRDYIKLRFSTRYLMIEVREALTDEAIKSERYDAIFTGFPDPNLKEFYQKEWLDYIEEFEDDVNNPKLFVKSSLSWYQVYLASHMLTPNGKIYACVSEGALDVTLDKRAREYFVNNNMIETVIKLPSLYTRSSAGVWSLVILSSNNKEINFIDASKMSEELDKVDYNVMELNFRINECYRCESEYKVIKTIEEVRDLDYVLDPSRYLSEIKFTDNYVKLEDLIKKSSRGSQFTSKELEKYISKEETDCCYITLANIENNHIKLDDVQYLNYNDNREELDKYLIPGESILISKVGEAKSCVCPAFFKKSLIANGNIFVLVIDEEKANPYYVQSYLQSKECLQQMEMLSTGSSLKSLSINSIKNIKIPLLTLNGQDIKGRRYRNKLYELQELDEQINSLKNELLDLFSQKENKTKS